MKNIFCSLIIISLLSCGNEKSSSNITDNDTLHPSETATGSEPKKLSNEAILKNINDEILNALQTKDYNRFASYIHPEKGVRFSMYGYVQKEKDKVFSQQDFIKYISKNTKFTWGEKDGTGDLLVLSLEDYLQTWVLKRNYNQAQYSLNEIKAQGNSINNIKEIYPSSNFTENYIPGSEQYGGMDWKSLRFVFELFEGEFKLVAVINDEWTV